MRSTIVVPLLAAALVADSAALADDYEWGEDPERAYVQPVAGYDVSVDVHGGVTVDSFYGELAPYGDWVVVANHGRVWRPRVVAGWRPYYYGRWEWTNEGWLWVSDEPWGWAAYHYGRWSYDPYYGWIWVPGVEWAPAWVSWRVSGDVIGWAPLAPGYSVYVTTYPFIDSWWTFVPCVRFASVPVYSVAFGPHVARRHFHATAPAPARPPRAGRAVAAPSPAWGGPAPRLIEERIGRPVTPARIVAAPAPGTLGRPGEIAVYRPDARVAAPHGNGRESSAAQARPGDGRGPGPVAAPGSPGGGARRQEGVHSDERGGWRPDARGGGQDGAGPRSGAAMAPPARGRGGGDGAGPRSDAVTAPPARGGGGGDGGGPRSGAATAPPARGGGWQPGAERGAGTPGSRSGAQSAAPGRSGDHRGGGGGGERAPAPRGGGGGGGGRSERGGRP